MEMTAFQNRMQKFAGFSGSVACVIAIVTATGISLFSTEMLAAQVVQTVASGVRVSARQLNVQTPELQTQELQTPEKRSDVVIQDFESESYGDWKVQGEAFGPGPAMGTLPGQMEVSGFQGKRLVNSFFDGDRTTGTLTSKPFTIKRDFMTFLIGGGGYKETTCMNLLIDSKVVRIATGPNRNSGGSERLELAYWDVKEFFGKQATVQIIDQNQGGWGHISVDDIRATDTQTGIDASEFGKEPNLDNFETYLEVGYNQVYRPQFHFTSLRNWLNDPNGMVYYDGEYHLFFQHNPLGTAWGNMTWGHAVSPDMLQWKQLPHAILPYADGTIFSGTAVVDHNNSLGVQQGDTKTLVAAFTFAKGQFSQALAYSTDRGRTFKLWNDGKPVVPNNGYDSGERDPKIFWHEASQKWVMVLWVKQAQPGRVLFFNSDDLRNWTEVSQFDRDWVFECMDMVELPIDGDSNNKKWLLYDASFEYEIGDFDGKTFTTDRVAHRGEYGPNYYAAQSFNDGPDDRKVLIGWMRGDNAPFVSHQMPFNQQMSIPATMTLKTTPQGVRLFRWPVQEISELYAGSKVWNDITLPQAKAGLSEFEAELVDLSISFIADAQTELSINVRGQEIRYQDEAFVFQNVKIPASPIKGVVSLRCLVDRASVELFANDGAAVGTFYAKLDPANESVSIDSEGDTKIMSLEVHRLKSVWTK